MVLIALLKNAKDCHCGWHHSLPSTLDWVEKGSWAAACIHHHSLWCDLLSWLSTTVDCTLEMWARTNPFSLQAPLSEYFITIMKENLRVTNSQNQGSRQEEVTRYEVTVFLEKIKTKYKKQGLAPCPHRFICFLLLFIKVSDQLLLLF